MRFFQLEIILYFCYLNNENYKHKTIKLNANTFRRDKWMKQTLFKT